MQMRECELRGRSWPPAAARIAPLGEFRQQSESESDPEVRWCAWGMRSRKRPWQHPKAQIQRLCQASPNLAYLLLRELAPIKNGDSQVWDPEVVELPWV